MKIESHGVNHATFSDDMRFRYRLTREFGRISTLVFCMLNPSTATAEENDPTIRRCIGYARLWGFGRLIVVNAYAYRSTDPHAMFALEQQGKDIVGPHNDEAIKLAAAEARAFDGFVVAAWGRHTSAARAARIAKLVGELRCLGINRDGSPVHPLYQPASAKPQPWRTAA